MDFDRDSFIDECRRARAEAEPQLAVREVVGRAVSEPAAVEREFGVAEGWRVEVLYNADDLTILHFVWPPTVDLFPHEHQMWSTVGIYGGVEDNTYYRRVGPSIEASGHRRGETGDVLLLGVDGIHSVQNTTRQWTAALHVYGSDFFAHPRLQWDPQTGQPRPFDLGNARTLLAEADGRARALGIV